VFVSILKSLLLIRIYSILSILIRRNWLLFSVFFFFRLIFVFEFKTFTKIILCLPISVYLISKCWLSWLVQITFIIFASFIIVLYIFSVFLLDSVIIINRFIFEAFLLRNWIFITFLLEFIASVAIIHIFWP